MSTAERSNRASVLAAVWAAVGVVAVCAVFGAATLPAAGPERPWVAFLSVCGLFLAFVELGVGLAARWYVTRIAEPLQRLRSQTQRAAQIGPSAIADDPGAHPDIRESARSLRQTVSELHDVRQQLSATTGELASMATEMFGTAKEQEVMASEQASAVEEIGRTMESLLSSSEDISESSQGVLGSAQKSQSTNQTISAHIQELISLGNQIGDVLDIIKGIANRADLLALNAALEGTKAGEAGKGFSLVAAEMRRLAENTVGSVGDIKALVGDVGKASQSSIRAMADGARLSDDTTDAAQRITLITQQQRSSTEQVMRSIEEITNLLQHNLAGVRGLTATAEQLSKLSESLRSSVASLDSSEIHIDSLP